MGAWIEISQLEMLMKTYCWSHPSWVRGLKFIDNDLTNVDIAVAPFMGAWIEMASLVSSPVPPWRRTLHGCVD